MAPHPRVLGAQVKLSTTSIEMLVVFFVLKAFQAHLEGKTQVKVMIDNTTAVTTLAHMGTGDTASSNDLACPVWDWCIDNCI